VPSTIGDEKRCNPFARLGSLPMFENEPGGPAERMRLVRKAKDDWGRR
jgi:hydroxyacylglutathione hydrolase